MARKVKEANFWVSYSDLATGLMIVFMVVMLLMVVRSKLQTAMQRDRVRDVVESIEIILSTKSKLAESINKALESEQVQADTVTAQVEIEDKALSFEFAKHRLDINGREFLARVIPPYVCALWQHDSATCREETGDECGRLDPERPRGVRRILVRGHGSLVGGYEENQRLSSLRAREVVQQAHGLLRDRAEAYPLAKSGNKVWDDLPAPCREDPTALYRYARERLWAVATSDTEHCTAVVNDSGNALWCDDLPHARKDDASFQKVTFGLEVTGDDMTGLLLDVVALRREVGGDQRQAGEVERIAGEVANACWSDPGSYHGCTKYVRECLGESTEGDLRNELCDEMFLALEGESGPALRRHVDAICADDDGALPRCGAAR